MYQLFRYTCIIFMFREVTRLFFDLTRQLRTIFVLPDYMTRQLRTILFLPDYMTRQLRTIFVLPDYMTRQ